MVPPTTCETESCGCIRCMNPHLIYNAIKRHANCADDFPNSLTEYLTQNFSCKKNASINYHDIKCINGSCSNQCAESLNSLFKESGDPKLVSYYVFESVSTNYTTKRVN